MNKHKLLTLLTVFFLVFGCSENKTENNISDENYNVFIEGSIKAKKMTGHLDFNDKKINTD